MSSISELERIVIVTGANSGIGKETVIGLSKTVPPHRIIMACRNIKVGEQVKSEIIKLTGNEKIHLHYIDLADLDSVKEFSSKILQEFERVDILVNNAGLATGVYTETSSANNQKFELQFCANHLGHFYITQLLLPHLQKSSDGRIINVSSSAHYRGQPSFEALLDKVDANLVGDQAREQFRKTMKDSYNLLTGYSHSKYANVLFTCQLVQELMFDYNKNKNITSVSLHPGVIKTNIGKNTGNKFVDYLIKLLFSIFGKSAEQGAQTSLHCCLADQDYLKKFNGYYFSASKPVYDPYTNEKKQKYAKLLWDLSDRLVKP